MAEQMKPSGVSWIGDIPFDWNIGKVRFETKIRAEKGCYTKNDTFIALENVSSFTGKYIASETEYDSGVYDIYKKGDLLYNKLRPYLAKALIAKDTGFCTGELEVISKYNGDMRFLFYYMLSDGFLKIVDSSTYGTKMPRANWDYIKNLAIPLLSNQEQKAIADYLDGRCAEIDSIIADIEKQIELLKQYKKSLITETVTKGLDKSVPMKDSKSIWFGIIPEHWTIQRFKYLCSYITDGSHFSPETVDEGLPYITAADVQGVGINYDSAKKISTKDYLALEHSGCRPQEGDSLLVKDGATTGRVGMVNSEQPCVVLSSVAILRSKEEDDNRFLMYLLESNAIQSQIRVSMAGSAMPRTTLSKIVNYEGVLCPSIEQNGICNYLDKQCEKIDAIISDKQQQLDTIQKHKKSLIYEYVTGKKRVKEAM